MYLAQTETPPEKLSRSTLAVIGGRGDAREGDPLSSPPVLASAFRAGGEHGYAREGSPTWEALEEAIGALEGGTAVSFSSGMSAIATVLEGVPPGGRVVLAGSAYLEARRLLELREAQGALRTTVVDAGDADRVADALPGADLLWLDSLSNPTLDVAKIDLLAGAARSEGVRVVVDGTLATPILQRPLELGADIVIHSATKHIGGHSDLLLGLAVARDPEEAETIHRARTALGAVPGTMDAWLALRGLRTLPLRIEREQSSAALLAERLADRPDVALVRYPGLPADPSHEAASSQLDGFGTMLSFVPGGGVARADALCRRVALITHATSLGGVETLIDRHSRCHAGAEVPDALLRLSVGCEDPEDLWADLEAALAATEISARAGAV